MINRKFTSTVKTSHLKNITLSHHVSISYFTWQSKGWERTTLWAEPLSLLCVCAEARGAFQDQQEGADIVWVHHPRRPGDGALPSWEQSHATLQTPGAAAAGVVEPGSAAPRHTDPSIQGLSAPSSSFHTVTDGSSRSLARMSSLHTPKFSHTSAGLVNAWLKGTRSKIAFIPPNSNVKKHCDRGFSSTMETTHYSHLQRFWYWQLCKQCWLKLVSQV